MPGRSSGAAEFSHRLSMEVYDAFEFELSNAAWRRDAPRLSPHCQWYIGCMFRICRRSALTISVLAARCAADAQETGHRYLRQGEGDRRLPLAGKFRRSGRETVGRRTKCRGPLLPRRASGPRRACRASSASSSSRPRPRYFPIEQRGGKIFAMKSDQQHQHQIVVTLTSLDDLSSERTSSILTPSTPSISPKSISRCPRWMAATWRHRSPPAAAKAETCTCTIPRPASRCPDVIPRVNYATAGGGVAWNADSSGFYYTRYPRDGERAPADMHFYQQVYFHKLGDKPENDTYEIGKDFPRIAEISFAASSDGRYIGLSVAYGDGGDHEYWLLAPGRPWRQLASVARRSEADRFRLQQGYLSGVEAWRAARQSPAHGRGGDRRSGHRHRGGIHRW